MSEAWPKWRPIETAPKDGTLVIIYDPRSHRAYACGFEFGIWQTGVWDSRGPVSPTHWLPLPPPPEGDAT